MRLNARRVDGADQIALIRLARPLRDPMRLRALFQPKVETIDAGFGIDALRLEAVETEPLDPVQTGAVLRSGIAGSGRRRASEDDRLADLIARIGNRIGFDAVIRLLPAESHVPERAFIMAAATWSEPGRWWPRPEPGDRETARPITLFPPEPVTELAPAPGTPLRPPARFRWRGRILATLRVTGPERIAPEWWWDDPAWRGGTRDYWQVETAEGPRLWLFHTPGAHRPAWQVHGELA